MEHFHFFLHTGYLLILKHGKNIILWSQRQTLGSAFHSPLCPSKGNHPFHAWPCVWMDAVRVFFILGERKHWVIKQQCTTRNKLSPKMSRTPLCTFASNANKHRTKSCKLKQYQHKGRFRWKHLFDWDSHQPIRCYIVHLSSIRPDETHRRYLSKASDTLWVI